MQGTCEPRLARVVNRERRHPDRARHCFMAWSHALSGLSNTAASPSGAEHEDWESGRRPTTHWNGPDTVRLFGRRGIAVELPALQRDALPDQVAQQRVHPSSPEVHAEDRLEHDDRPAACTRLNTR